MGVFFWVGTYSNIFLGCLKFLIFFFGGGGGGGGGVNCRCWAGADI